MTTLRVSLIKAPLPGKRPGERVKRRASPPARLWWELIAGPGPLALRLLRWSQRNAAADPVAPTHRFR